MKHDLFLASPLLNAAGTLGFSPRAGMNWLGQLGAFITNPISLHSRTPAHDRTLIPFEGGALLHTGLINPGLHSVLHHHASHWAGLPVPVWVHLIASAPEEVSAMTRQLEGLENVHAVELGLPPGISASAALSLAKGAHCELPLVLQLPFEEAEHLGPVLKESPAAAFSLAAPRGLLPENGRLASGRLLGPALLPQALRAVHALAKAGCPVIGSGGITCGKDLLAMLEAGASAVQLDTVLWGLHDLGDLPVSIPSEGWGFRLQADDLDFSTPPDEGG